MPRKKQDDDAPRCGGCEYFMGKPRATDGTCRRYPPSVVLREEDLMFMQPAVPIGGWCAEYRRRVS